MTRLLTGEEGRFSIFPISIPTIISFILLLLALVYQFLIHPIFLSPVAKIPAAHPLAAISDLWILYIRYANVENATLLRLHRAKGPILRLGRNEVSVNCYEEGLKTIYGGNFDKGEFYPRRFANYGGVTNMLSIKKGKEHATRKRMLSSIYSKSQIMTSPTARNSLTTIIYQRFLPLFQTGAETGEPIDVLSLSYAYSIDSFMGYQFGLELGSNFIQDVEQREWYLRNFMGRRPYLFWILEVPRLYGFLQKIGVQLIPAWFFQGIKEIEGWNLDICDAAEKSLQILGGESVSVDQPVVFSTMRTAMLKADEKSGRQNGAGSQTQQYPNRLEIASEMLDHNAAALETSGVILTYMFFELSLRPKMQAQLRKELRSLSPPISTLATSLPDPKTLDVLPLLDAIIQETMRLYAPAPGPQPRVTPFPSCRLAGIDHIPGGVRVSANGWCLHRNENVFPQPEEWKPERWMDANERELTEMKRWLWAFSSGGRMCIGSHFALNSLKHAVAAVYTDFESSVVEADGMEQTEGYVAGPQGDKVSLGFKKV